MTAPSIPDLVATQPRTPRSSGAGGRGQRDPESAASFADIADRVRGGSSPRHESPAPSDATAEPDATDADAVPTATDDRSTADEAPTIDGEPAEAPTTDVVVDLTAVAMTLVQLTSAHAIPTPPPIAREATATMATAEATTAAAPAAGGPATAPDLAAIGGLATAPTPAVGSTTTEPAGKRVPVASVAQPPTTDGDDGAAAASVVNASSTRTPPAAATPVSAAHPQPDDARPQPPQAPVAPQPAAAVAAPTGPAAPVQVPRTAPTEAASPAAAPAEPWQQVVDVLRPLRKLTDGTHRMTLQLRPADLGVVHVELALTGSSVSVHLVAETPAARDALARSLDDLRRDFSDGGLRSAWVAVGDQSTGGGSRSAHWGTRSGLDAASTPTSAGPVLATGAAPTSSAVPTVVDGRLDVRI